MWDLHLSAIVSEEEVASLAALVFLLLGFLLLALGVSWP